MQSSFAIQLAGDEFGLQHHRVYHRNKPGKKGIVKRSTPIINAGIVAQFTHLGLSAIYGAGFFCAKNPSPSEWGLATATHVIESFSYPQAHVLVKGMAITAAAIRLADIAYRTLNGTSTFSEASNLLNATVQIGNIVMTLRLKA